MKHNILIRFLFTIVIHVSCASVRFADIHIHTHTHGKRNVNPVKCVEKKTLKINRQVHFFTSTLLNRLKTLNSIIMYFKLWDVQFEGISNRNGFGKYKIGCLMIKHGKWVTHRKLQQIYIKQRSHYLKLWSKFIPSVQPQVLFRSSLDFWRYC